MCNFYNGCSFIVRSGSLQIQVVLVGGCCIYYPTALVRQKGMLELIHKLWAGQISRQIFQSWVWFFSLLMLTYRKRSKNDSTKKKTKDSDNIQSYYSLENKETIITVCCYVCYVSYFCCGHRFQSSHEKLDASNSILYLCFSKVSPDTGW